MKVYITKYALSKGIIEAEVEQITRAVVSHREDGKVNTYYAGEWHTEQDKAIAVAEKMREERIKICRRTIELMEELSFQIGNTSTPTYRYNRNKPVIQCTMTDEIREEYTSIIQAANKTGYAASGISRCCSGEVMQYKGFKWKFKP